MKYFYWYPIYTCHPWITQNQRELSLEEDSTYGSSSSESHHLSNSIRDIPSRNPIPNPIVDAHAINDFTIHKALQPNFVLTKDLLQLIGKFSIITTRVSCHIHEFPDLRLIDSTDIVAGFVQCLCHGARVHDLLAKRSVFSRYSTIQNCHRAWDSVVNFVN